MLTLAEWIIRLTKGYIKFTGKKPDGLAKLKIKMEAAERIKQQNKVTEFPKDKITPFYEPRPGEKGFKPKVEPIKKVLSDDEATAQINKLREDFNFNDRKQVLQLFDDIDAGKAFGAFDDVQKKELRDMISKMYTEKPDFASGGIARTGYFAGLIAKGAAKAGKGKFTKSEVLIQMLENTLKGSKDAYVKKTFPNFIKELQKNPKLALDENVWKQFTTGLPKNQRLVVHSDDTVDFFTQSEFGPHNIEPTLEFQKKHNLSRDQANKILRMEPEDRVLEMKRLETLADRSRTKQASGGIAGQLHLNEGGRVPMIFGGSPGLRAKIASIIANINKGRTEKIKKLFPTYSVAEKELLKLGEKYLPKDSATLAAKEIEAKAEGIDVLINSLKHDKKILKQQAKNKAMNDPNLDFLMESLEKTMPEAYGPHLKKYKNIDKDILQLETIKKNLIMKDRKLNAEGGRVSLSNGGLANILGV